MALSQMLEASLTERMNDGIGLTTVDTPYEGNNNLIRDMMGRSCIAGETLAQPLCIGHWNWYERSYS